MDTTDAMRLFVRVVERRSFSTAATDLGIKRSTASEAIRRLEARLGARLLERSTRQVRPTVDGEAYYRRCVAILADIEDAESALSDASPRGLVRLDVHPKLARHFLLPGLPDFLARYPGIRLHIGEGDRLVDLIAEGVDCVVRAGELRDSGLVARRVGLMHEVTCASPTYLARHGMPRTPDELAGHRSVGFFSSSLRDVLPLEFMVGERVEYRSLPAPLTVSGSEAYIELARLGFGLIQVPRYGVEEDLAAGTLVEVLPDTPPEPSPVYVLYPQNRQVAPRVRVFIDWMIAEFARRAADVAAVEV
jgi:DNA-binding transcriptional LysR family regulator